MSSAGTPASEDREEKKDKEKEKEKEPRQPAKRGRKPANPQPPPPSAQQDDGDAEEGSSARPSKREKLDAGQGGAGTSGVVKERKERAKLQKRNLFNKDLPSMMYSFGDDPDPLPETVSVMEEILADYLTDICKAAAMHSTNAKKLKMEDLKFALRKPQQRRQLARVEELLFLQADIASARKNLDFTGAA